MPTHILYDSAGNPTGTASTLTPEEAAIVAATATAQAALRAERSEVASLAGIQLNADPVKRAKAQPIENCKSLKKLDGTFTPTRVLHTMIEGVRVRIAVIPDDDSEG